MAPVCDTVVVGISSSSSSGSSNASVLLWAWCLAQLPRQLSPMDGAQCMWNAAGGCRRLIPVPLLPYTSHQPNWDCRSNLVKNGCCYCATGYAFWLHGLLGAHVGWSRKTMGRGWRWGVVVGEVECLFLALKRWQSSTLFLSLSLATLLSPFLAPCSTLSLLTLRVHQNNNKAGGINSGWVTFTWSWCLHL